MNENILRTYGGPKNIALLKRFIKIGQKHTGK